jgi:prevent-host-death family protein
MSKQVNLYEAKTNLSQLVEEAAKGSEIVIAKNAKPMARLVALEKPARLKKRKLGSTKLGIVEVGSREDADKDVSGLFKGSRLWPNT